jgi:sugar phosphate isomerase/epimerase
MIKFGICSEIFQGATVEDALAAAARIGYDGVEIAPYTIAKYVTDIDASQRARIRETAAKLGIAVSGIHWVLAFTEGLHINHPDPAVRRQTADYCVALVDCCADFGGRHVIFGSPKQRNVLEGVSREQAWQWAQETWRPGIRRAEERGIIICIEPLTPGDTNFITTAREAIAFTEPLSSPNFKIILDVRAMHSENRPVPEIIRESWPHFAYFHCNDVNDKGPGFGNVDYAPIVAALKEVGYHGYATVEVFKFDEGSEIIATRSLEYLRRVFGGPVQ